MESTTTSASKNTPAPSTTRRESGAQSGTASTPIDVVVGQVERLYKAVAGREPPMAEESASEIPPEKDPGQFIETQVDRLIAALGGSFAATQEPMWLPPVSLSESQDEYLYQVDLAGVRKEDMRVMVVAGAIDVSGNRHAELGAALQRQLASERPMGTFRRSLPLPVDVAVNDLSAQLSDGVLSIRIPRARVSQGGGRGVPIA